MKHINNQTFTKIRRKALQAFRFARRTFPLTLTGCLLAAVAGVAIWTQGIEHQDLVLFSGAVILLAVQALLLLVVLCATLFAWLRTRRAHAAEGELQLETGLENPTSFAVAFPGWLPFVTFSWEWIAPTDVEVHLKRQGSLLQEIVTPGCRALTNTVQRKFTIRDFLGLSEISWLRSDPLSVRILPSRLTESGLALPLGLGLGEDLSDPDGSPIGDQVEMREYRPGDSPRLIRWKLYARSGKLLIRMPERAVAERPSACGYLLGGKTASSAAQLARELLERGNFGGEFLFGAEGSNRVSHGDMELARDIIAESGAAKPGSMAGLRDFLQKAAADGGFSDCLLFAPADNKVATELAAFISSSPIELRMVVCVTELATETPIPWWKNIIFRLEKPMGVQTIRTRFGKVKGLCDAQIFEQRSGGFFAL